MLKFLLAKEPSTEAVLAQQRARAELDYLSAAQNAEYYSAMRDMFAQRIRRLAAESGAVESGELGRHSAVKHGNTEPA